MLVPATVAPFNASLNGDAMLMLSSVGVDWGDVTDDDDDGIDPSGGNDVFGTDAMTIDRHQQRLLSLVAPADSHCVVTADGSKEWRHVVTGALHRDRVDYAAMPDVRALVLARIGRSASDVLLRYLTYDTQAPAVVRPDGTREWRVNGLLHRDGDLPALEKRDGSRWWYVAQARSVEE